jgi:hypothetical protein
MKKGGIMHKNKFITFTIISLVFIVTVGSLVHIAIEAEMGSVSEKNRSSVILPFIALGILVCAACVAFLYPHVVQRNSRLASLLKIGAVAGLLLFLPHSVIVYEKATFFVHSKFVGFAIYNVMELVIGRLILKLLSGPSKSSS